MTSSVAPAARSEDKDVDGGDGGEKGTLKEETCLKTRRRRRSRNGSSERWQRAATRSA